MQNVYTIKDRGTNVMDFGAFTLKEGATEAQLFEIHEKVYKEFFSKCKGFIDNKLLFDGVKYYDLTIYASVEDAKVAADAFATSFVPAIYSKIINPPTEEQVPFFHILKSY
ncbi:MAG: hypothetical protein FWE03_02985 [Firmicutes bacterium]|nr:hypothetical protein [Bacillota bacterium]